MLRTLQFPENTGIFNKLHLPEHYELLNCVQYLRVGLLHDRVRSNGLGLH